MRDKLDEKLKTVLPGKYIIGNEFQDKYFLMKTIKSVLPELTDAEIYSGIDICSTKLKSPMKRDDFIRTFLNQNFPILYAKNMIG